MKIKTLKILSSNFEEQVLFYTQTIGLKLLEKSESKAMFAIGTSVLSLVKADESRPYHFAINIPSNQEVQALDWLKQRVDILKDGKNEIQDFDFWNAKAIYFYDKDKNIVEFIARKNLKIENNEKFSAESLLAISEIGLPVNDLKVTYDAICAIAEVPIFSGGLERFCAIGDGQGLFICIDKKIKDWYPTGEKAHSSAFGLSFSEKGKEHALEFKDGKVKALIDDIY